MPQAARISDVTTGHNGFPPQNILTGKQKVIIQGIPAATYGDVVSSHCNPSGCHDSVIASGSTKVFIQGEMAARLGDAIACGGNIATGAEKVIIG